MAMGKDGHLKIRDCIDYQEVLIPLSTLHWDKKGDTSQSTCRIGMKSRSKWVNYTATRKEQQNSKSLSGVTQWDST